MASYDDTATVSGSVVSIENGADEVGAKSCVVTVRPTLSGVSSVTETQTGRNLFNLDRTEGTPDPTDIIISPRILDVTKLFKGLRADNYFYAGYASYSISNGVLSVTTSNNLNYGIAFPVRVKGGATYCLSAILTGANMSVGCYDKDWNFISRIFGMVSDASISFSTPSNAEYITVVFGSSTLNVEGTVSNIQLEIGSTAHAYEQYQTPTTYTASLGRTIYGGQADIVNGTGVDNTTRIQIKDRTWTITEVGTSFKVFTCNKITTKEANFNFQVEGYVNAETYRNYLQDKQCGTYNTTNAMDRIVIRDDSYTTVEDFLTAVGDNYIVFENTSPTDFTFTGQEVPTRLGYNAFWSEQGDTELTYYKDGYGFTSVTVHKETPDGEPVEETRKLHRIIYEGQVDVISGTGLIYRGESGTQYDPPEQISFTPIEVSTDEGENTLYSDEGDSAITYRKAVD